MHAEIHLRMSTNKIKDNKMVAKNKNKVSCSTPEHRVDSPSKDSDSIYDSEAASPVPFQCTQDGVEGERDVVWNFYTPTSKASNSYNKNSTPVSKRVKKTIRPKVIEKAVPKRKMIKSSQKKNELLQDLITLNQNVLEFLPKKKGIKTEKSQSEEDMFSDTSDSSPKSTFKNKTRCLRKNVLSSKFINSETENGLESDDSINECLIKVSQMVEDKILNTEFNTNAKRPCLENAGISVKPNVSLNVDQDSIDAILCNVNLDSPFINKVKKCDSPRLNNDSFDNLLGNLDDSALERLSQIPVKNDASKKRKENANWTIKELVGSSPSNKSTFGRHNSMPESPSVTESNKPSTSGMVFGRYNSMPFNKSEEIILDDSPIRCTPDEIKKKHQQAREKLLAKRQLPFTSSELPLMPSRNNAVQKKPMFQYKIPPSKNPTDLKLNEAKSIRERESNIKTNTNEYVDIKLLIEKKRQEALMKLKRRQLQNKSS